MRQATQGMRMSGAVGAGEAWLWLIHCVVFQSDF